MALRAREFLAPDDHTALIVSNLIYRACSDTCYSCELWQGHRRVTAFDGLRAGAMVAPADQQTIEIQQITLTLEEALQNSKWRVARSEKLLIEMQRLRQRSEARLTRPPPPQTG